jgi:hypothetical protein
MLECVPIAQITSVQKLEQVMCYDARILQTLAPVALALPPAQGAQLLSLGYDLIDSLTALESLCAVESLVSARTTLGPRGDGIS